MSNKTEKATAYKLKKAKEKGQVNKSIELNTSFFLFLMTLVGTALWPSFFKQMKAFLGQLLNLAGQFSFNIENLRNLISLILFTLINWWLPFALAAVLSLILLTLSQTGFVWSLYPLRPDLKRLGIKQGFKRIFSSKILFDLIKNSLKLSLVFLVLFFSMRHELSTLLHLMAREPLEQPSLIIAFVLKLLLQILSVLLSFAIIDKLYINYKFQKDNRMSKQEIKEEYRQREGDPKIKAKIKLLQQQLRQKTASLEQVKTADVVITNPTHLAIALKYERRLMPSPQVVCKAQGEFAHQVRNLAQKHQVPIIQNKVFARALFTTTKLNEWIGQEHFPIAAAIFKEIYQQREQASC